MNLTGEAALKEAQRIAKDHHMYIVHKNNVYLLFRPGHEHGRGLLIHRADSAKKILEATCRHAGVPVPGTEEQAF